jgi:hypothetical protein
MAGALDTLTSNILPGESGGVPTDLPVAAAPTKGALPAPTDFASIKGPKGTSMVLDPTSSEQILANMQDFINQRTNKSKLDTFSDALTRSHMLIHPEALTQYDKAQEDKAKETYDMQMQLAQYKNALAQQKSFGEFRNKLYGNQPAETAAGAPSSGTAAGTATTAAGTAAAPSVVKTSGGQSFSFGQLPPEIQASALGQTDYASFQKVIDEWAKKHAEQAQQLSNNLTVEEKKHGYAMTEEENKFLNSGEAHKQYDWYNENTGKLEKRTPYEVKMRGLDSTLTPTQPIPGYVTSKAKATAPADQSGYKGVAADVNNPVGIGGAGNFAKYETPQDGVKAAIDLNTRYVNGQGPMSGIAPTVENMTSVWVNGKPGTNPPGYSTFVKQELSKAGVKLNADSTVPNTPEAIKALTAARIKFESGKNAGKFLPYLDSAPAAAAPSAAAPAAAAPSAAVPTTPAAAAPTSGKSFGEFQVEQEAEKAATKTEAETRAKETGNRYNATVSAHQSANSDMANAQYINDVINKNPNAVGVLAHSGILSALGTVIKNGAEANASAGQIGASGGIHMRAIEEAVLRAGGTQEDIDAAQKLAQKFAELQLNAAKTYLKGQGAVSDNERLLIGRMTGSESNSPAALRDMLYWGQMRAGYNKKVGDALEVWEQAHPNASFRQFELTPEFKKLQHDQDIGIKAYLAANKNATSPKNNAAPALPPGVDPKRYAAWKAQQAQKQGQP